MDFDDELHKEIILEHYKSQKNRGTIEHEHAKHGEGANPLCGDDLEFSLLIEDGKISDILYGGSGCSISSASADMLCGALRGKSVAQAKEIIKQFKGMLLEDEKPEFEEVDSDLEAMEGVKKFPVRIKCAILAWNTIDEMLKGE